MEKHIVSIATVIFVSILMLFTFNSGGLKKQERPVSMVLAE